MNKNRYYAEMIEVYDDNYGRWSEQWLVSDDQRHGIDGLTFDWLFEIKCVNKDHALRVAQALNKDFNAEHVSQEDARELASDLRPSRLFK